MVWFALVLVAILIIGGVEINPGPEMKQVMGMLKHIAEEMTELKGMEKRIEDKMVKEFEGIKTAWSNLKQEVNREFIECNRRMTNLEKAEERRRKMNVIIFGIEEVRGKHVWEQVEEIVQDKLGIKLGGWEIVDTFRIGRRGINPRPIVVKLATVKIKWTILSSAKKLKGTKIFVENDYGKKEREIRSVLLKEMKNARARGDKAYVRGLDLWINDRKQDISQLNTGNMRQPAENTRASDQETKMTPRIRSTASSGGGEEGRGEQMTSPTKQVSPERQLIDDARSMALGAAAGIDVWKESELSIISSPGGSILQVEDGERGRDPESRSRLTRSKTKLQQFRFERTGSV